MKALTVFLAVAVFWATPSWAQAPAGASEAVVTAVCKDGTPFSGKTLRGACRGHGGVDKAAGAAAPAVKSAPVKASAAAPAAARSRSAPGGTAGQVWANTETKVYHCAGDRYYGKTKQGEYLSEAQASAQGFRAARGKVCGAN